MTGLADVPPVEFNGARVVQFMTSDQRSSTEGVSTPRLHRRLAWVMAARDITSSIAIHLSSVLAAGGVELR